MSAATSKRKMTAIIVVVVIVVAIAATAYNWNMLQPPTTTTTAVATTGETTAVATTGETTAVATTGETLLLALQDKLTGLDPAVDYAVPAGTIYGAAVESLLVMKRGVATGTVEILPRLATSWKTEQNSTVWTFNLRQGVKFHDGTAFNATAVKFSLERVLKINKGPVEFLKIIKSVDIVDTYTVRITLQEARPFDRMMTAHMVAGIISPSSALKHEVNGDWGQEWCHKNVIGTGPYMFVEWKEGEYVKFVKFKDYWKGWKDTKNNIDTVIWVQIIDASQRRIALQTGRIDGTTSLIADDVVALKSDPAINMMVYTSYASAYIGLNNLKGPTADIRVRKAIAYAFNNTAMIGDVMRGLVTRSQGPLPSLYPEHNNDVPIIYQNLTKAKEFLAEAGYKPGQLTLHIWYNAGIPWKQGVCELLQSNLKQIGVNVEIHVTAWPTIAEQITNPDKFPDMVVIYNDSEFASPMIQLDSLWHSTGHWNHGYRNARVDQLLEAARRSTDPQEQMRLYKEAQTVITNDFPDVFIFDFVETVALGKSVKGFIPNPTSMDWNLYDMYIARS